MIFLRILDTSYYYAYQPVTLVEYATYALLLIGLILFFYLIKYLTSGKSTSNSLDFQDENRLVSPFLIEEQNAGLLYFSSKKKSIFIKVTAIVFIILFIINSLGSILEPLNLFYKAIF